MKKYLLFACLLGISQISLAQNTLDGMVKLVPEQEVGRQSDFINAEKERILQHWDKAIPLYKNFLRENPDNDAAWFGMARCEFAKKNFDTALENINKAVAIAPANQWYRVLQADIYDQLGRTKDAAAVFAELTKMYPQTREFYEKQAYYAVLSGDPQGGLKALDQLEKVIGVTEETCMKKHVIYLGMSDNKRAAGELQRLADTYPNRLEYRHRLAKFYTETGDKNAARKVYEDILRRNPNDREAQLALLDRKTNASETAYLESLFPIFSDPVAPIDPKIQQIAPYLSKLTPSDPNAPAMIRLAEALEKAHPNDPKTYSVSGGVFYQLDRPNEALEKYRHCLRLNPNVFGAWENTMTILDEQKNYDELLKTAEQAMDAFPNQPKGYLFYGVAATEKGRYDDAVSQLEQALIMAGNSPLRLDILDQLGVVLTRKKDYPGAAKRFEQALAKGGEQHAGVLEHYGDLLSLQNDKKGAQSYWQKAYDLSKNPALLEKLK
ncbi:MAG: tetratricopeptide repeat protein [Saprospiraceae bacterium]|nr:tetratricopeptide repeat protein [Saprospiraceae bacterium]